MRKRSGAFRADPADSPEDVAKILEKEQSKRDLEVRMEQQSRKEREREDEQVREQERLQLEKAEEDELARQQQMSNLYNLKRAEANQPFDHFVKVLLLGDSGVGKSSLMLRYAEDTFSSTLISTAGVDFKVRYIDMDGKRVKFQVWDTAGQERFHTITKAYYKGAMGIVLVYDVTSADSFANIGYWMANINENSQENVAKIVIANKMDMPDKKIDAARGKACADQYGAPFFETSAKENVNVSEAFMAIARDIIARQIASGTTTAMKKSVSLKGDKDKKKKKTGETSCVLL